MKHHFGDFLDRNGDYWTTVSNKDRFAFIANFDIANKDEVKILTLTKHQEKQHWQQVFDCLNLEELTLHDPSKDQVQAIRYLTNIKRLRITFFRPSDIEFIGDMSGLEEIVLEYVSGFTDLSPLQRLQSLKSLHLENLRRVSNFDGLKGIKSLRYLSIDGTLDWDQPINNFDFLSGLPNLEVLSLGWIKNASPYPALVSLLTLKKLKRIKLISNKLPTKEFAFIEKALPNVSGAVHELLTKSAYETLPLPDDDFRWKLTDQEIRKYHPVIHISHDGSRKINDPNSEWFDLLGRSAGRIKCNSPKADEKIQAFKQKYEEYKQEAEMIIQDNGTKN